VRIDSIMMVGVIASPEGSTTSAENEFINTISGLFGFMFTVFFGLWALALLAGSAWTIRTRGLFSKDSDIEAVVDAWLESEP